MFATLKQERSEEWKESQRGEKQRLTVPNYSKSIRNTAISWIDRNVCNFA